MALGQRILQARQKAGLSQRQLCGDVITRNMLSQIEHGTARPSMDTLRYLAGRLDLPVSWFLEEDAAVSSNQAGMDRARDAFDNGDYAGALTVLAQFQLPDPLYDRERELLEQLCLLGSAQMAIREGRDRYAAELLERAEGMESRYFPEELQRRCRLLMAQIRQRPLAELTAQLPSLDGELMLRGEGALEAGDPRRAAALLDAADDQTSPRWNLLRGRAEMRLGDHAGAISYLEKAEANCPVEAVPLLEQCCRELGDYQRAYHYACLQKK